MKILAEISGRFLKFRPAASLLIAKTAIVRYSQKNQDEKQCNGWLSEPSPFKIGHLSNCDDKNIDRKQNAMHNDRKVERKGCNGNSGHLSFATDHLLPNRWMHLSHYQTRKRYQRLFMAIGRTRFEWADSHWKFTTRSVKAATKHCLSVRQARFSRN